MTVTTFLSMLGDLAVGMGAWLPLTFFCSVCETGHGPSRRMWVAPHVQASPLLVLTLSPLLGFILFCVFNHLQPLLFNQHPLPACGGTGTQTAPGTCQSRRDGNGGAEKPPPRQMGPSEDLCGAGPLWPSFYVVSSQTRTWALHSQFLLRKNVKK